MALITDEEAKARLKERQAEMKTMWGVPIPEGEWVGPGAADEFNNGRGKDDDDSERTGTGIHHH